MNKKTGIVALLAPLLITVLFCGCGTMQPQRQRAPRTAVFNEDEYAPYAGNGTATISGQAFLKTRGGDVKFGAGNRVVMNPVTSYSTEWFERYIVGGIPLEKADVRAEKCLRETIADGNGNFIFNNLPAGEYYLVCQILWEVPSQYGPERTGGWVYAKVRVGPGEERRVIITK